MVLPGLQARHRDGGRRACSPAALAVGLASAVAPSMVTGPGAGLSLLAFGVATLPIGSRAPG